MTQVWILYFGILVGFLLCLSLTSIPRRPKPVVMIGPVPLRREVLATAWRKGWRP